MIDVGAKVTVGGEQKVVKSWDATWSLKLSAFPHLLYILFEGETKYQKFESDDKGSFAELEIA